MKQALSDYKDAYQVQLATDETEKLWDFIVLWGLKPYLVCVQGMILVDRKNFYNNFFA